MKPGPARTIAAAARAARSAWRALAALALVAMSGAVAPAAADTSWIDQTLLDAARKEGSIVVYSAVNEEEGLALWKIFERETGLRVDYVRTSDAQAIARILIEARAGRQSWDLLHTPSVHKLPQTLLAQIDVPEAVHALAEARDPARRWFGATAIYQTPAYNTAIVNAQSLPKSHEELARRADWAGRVAINETDTEWIASILAFYGEDRGRRLLQEMVATLKPVMVAGHLALARAVAAGEYSVALSNYAHLTMNAKLNGGTTDFWALDPVGVFFNEIGVNVGAPHPNAARLAANFVFSKVGQQQLTTRGRVPTRRDVDTNPPGMLKPIEGRKLVPVVLSAEQEKKADAMFKELIGGRAR